MSFPQGWSAYYEDSMVKRWSIGKGTKRRIASVGKRVPKNFLLTSDERRVYTKDGIVLLVKILRDNRNLSFKDAYHLIKIAQGHIKKSYNLPDKEG